MYVCVFVCVCACVRVCGCVRVHIYTCTWLPSLIGASVRNVVLLLPRAVKRSRRLGACLFVGLLSGRCVCGGFVRVCTRRPCRMDTTHHAKAYESCCITTVVWVMSHMNESWHTCMGRVTSGRLRICSWQYQCLCLCVFCLCGGFQCNTFCLVFCMCVVCVFESECVWKRELCHCVECLYLAVPLKSWRHLRRVTYEWVMSHINESCHTCGALQVL